MKQHLLFLPLLFFSSIAFTQYEIELEWTVKNQTNNWGGNIPKARPPQVLADGQGGVYYCGSTYHPGPSTGLLVIHYDSKGDALWRDTLDDPGVDQLGDALVDQEGNLILVRNITSGFGFYALYIVYKYSPVGEKIWEYYNFEVDIPSQLGDMELDENGDLYLFGGWANYTDSVYALATVKLDGKKGEVLWENELLDSLATFGPQRGRLLDDRLMVLARKRSSPQTYVLHQFDLNGQSTETIVNDYPGSAEFNDWAHIDEEGNTYLGLNAWGYRLTKVTPSGDTTWVYERPPSITGIVGNRMVSINSDADLNVYSVGPYRQEDGYIYVTTTKLQPDGTILWQKDFSVDPGKTHDSPNRSFIQDSILFIVGLSQVAVTPDSNDVDYLVVAYSLDGEELFHFTYEDGFQSEAANSGSFDTLNNLFIGGYNDYPWPDERNDQYILKYKVDFHTTVSSPPSQNLHSQVFPNPLSGEMLQVKLPPGQTISRLRLFDSAGKKSPLNWDGNQVSLGVLPAGVYWLEVTWAEGQEIHRLVKP